MTDRIKEVCISPRVSRIPPFRYRPAIPPSRCRCRPAAVCTPTPARRHLVLASSSRLAAASMPAATAVMLLVVLSTMAEAQPLLGVTRHARSHHPAHLHLLSIAYRRRPPARRRRARWLMRRPAAC
ncbi:hypothetical protein B0H14DRAFT_3882423 [Mycena olivaceomarginata]|nr:hypothetical protein B0H14DRAFT_3882423 [Mycena olivaceomarginata]